VISKIIMFIRSYIKNDPVHSCDVYKSKGCAHIDGMLCDMKTCPILEEFRENEPNT